MHQIKIINPGLLSTIQDDGRSGYQAIGMPVGGAMDINALRMANYLVGNSALEAGIEMTLLGCTIEFFSATYIAVSGANPEMTLNQKKVSPYRTLKIKKGDILEIGRILNGARSYLAIAGGFNLPSVMDSKSTYLYGKIGGFHGRALKPDDVIPINGNPGKMKRLKIKKQHIFLLPKEPVIRILPGPEKERFSWKGLTHFLTESYTLSPQCDRMGYRLNGSSVEHVDNDADIISSPIAYGTIQVPRHGSPIIMMADRQTTGGYTRIANVITADFSALAQLMPGDKIRFKETTIENAVELLEEQNKVNLRYTHT